jgi:hypothetical protein
MKPNRFWVFIVAMSLFFAFMWGWFFAAMHCANAIDQATADIVSHANRADSLNVQMVDLENHYAQCRNFEVQCRAHYASKQYGWGEMEMIRIKPEE